MDEKANIIIDDEVTKRELHKRKMLQRRSTLETHTILEPDENDDFNELTNEFTNDVTQIVSNFDTLNPPSYS